MNNRDFAEEAVRPQTFNLTWRFMGGYRVVISRVTMIKTHIRRLITLPITTHEPPSIPDHQKDVPLLDCGKPRRGNIVFSLSRTFFHGWSSCQRSATWPQIRCAHPIQEDRLCATTRSRQLQGLSCTMHGAQRRMIRQA